MNITVTEKEPHLYNASIEVEKEDYQEEYNKKIREGVRQAKIPGFRSGHIPKGLIEKRIGKEVLLQLASEKAEKEFQAYIKENNHVLLTRPIMANIEDEKWFQEEIKKIEIEFCIQPNVEISFSNVSSPKFYKIEITDKEFEKQIEEKRKTQYATQQKVDEPIPEEEEDYRALIKEFPKSPEEESPIVVILKNLEKKGKIRPQFIGKKKGDTVDLVFSEGDKEEYKYIFGEEEEFSPKKVTSIIESVEKSIPHELNAEFFVQDYGISAEYEVPIEERKKIAKDIQEKAHNKGAKQKYVKEVFDILLEKISFDLPEEFLFQSFLSEQEQPLPEDKKEEIKKIVLANYSQSIINTLLQKQNNITIDEKALEGAVKKHFDDYYGERKKEVPEGKKEETIQFLLGNENAKSMREYYFKEASDETFFTLFSEKLSPKPTVVSEKEFNEIIEKSK